MSKCLLCGKAGHLAKVCLSSPTKDTVTAKKVEAKEEVTETAPDSSESCRTIIVQRTSTEAEAPPAMLWLNQIGKNKFQIAGTADTGCSVTILSNKIAEREKLELHQTNVPRLLTTTGQKMHVNGKINLDLTSAWQKGKIDRLGRWYALGNKKTSKRIQRNPTRTLQYNTKRPQRILLQNNCQAMIRRVHSRIWRHLERQTQSSSNERRPNAHKPKTQCDTPKSHRS